MSDNTAATTPTKHRTITIGASPARARATARVCEAASCISGRSSDITTHLAELTADVGDINIKRVGCLGLCAAGPLVEIAETGQLFEHVSPDAVAPIVAALKEVAPGAIRQPQGPFFEKQVRVATENFGLVDPESLEDYLGHGRLPSPAKVLSEMTSAEVRDQISASGLRGRGGAGYPTGLKWTTVAKAAGDKKYVICNADEGDPGAFMDRSVLESDPYRVLEGMAIAAFAVHANEGYIYCRAEYPLAVARLRTAIRLAQRAGYLGDNIMDTSFSFNVEIRLGAGAFVCGEETALIASVEGRRGTPRPRPPFPATEGLWGKPTLINNVEIAGQRAHDHPRGAGEVRRHRHRQVQGHQGLRPRRPRRQHRPGRGPHGHDPAGDHLRHRRRHHRRPALQGGADRRPVRRLHPGRAPGHAGRPTSRSSSSARSWARAA